MRIRLWQVGLVAALTGASEVPGQGIRITLLGGGTFVQAERTFVVNDSAFQSRIQKSGKVGLRAASDMTDHLAVEVGYSLGRHTLRIAELGTPIRNRAFETAVHQLTGDLLYYFGPLDSGLQPFAGAGLGFFRFSPTEEAEALALSSEFLDGPAQLKSSNRFGVSFGGGVEGKLNDWLGLRFDLRDHIYEVPRFGLPERRSESGGVFYPIFGSIHSIDASVGVVFYLR